MAAQVKLKYVGDVPIRPSSNRDDLWLHSGQAYKCDASHAKALMSEYPDEFEVLVDDFGQLKPKVRAETTAAKPSGAEKSKAGGVITRGGE